MSGFQPLKKPKVEIEEDEPEENGNSNVTTEEQLRKDNEVLLLDLIEHRTKQVDDLRRRVSLYKSELDEAVQALEDTHKKLVHLRSQSMASKASTSGKTELKVGRNSTSSVQMREGTSPKHLSQDNEKSAGIDHEIGRIPPNPFARSVVFSKSQTQTQTQSKPKLFIPPVPTFANNPQPLEMKELGNNVSSGSDSLPSSSMPIHVNGLVKPKDDKARRKSVKEEPIVTPQKGTKRKLEQEEHKDLITLIGRSTSPQVVNYQTCYFCPSQHKRKLRTLVLCPTNEHLFVTSALDGVVNLWQVQEKDKGPEANILSTAECLSKERKWPEDIAWHPQGQKLFSVYSADNEDSQVSVLKLARGNEKAHLSYLEDKPHTKGIINSITFMPWDSTSFVTGGSDHAVVLWTDKDDKDL